MRIEHEILSALCIYAAENGPLKVTKEQVLAFNGHNNWGVARLVPDENGDFWIHVERVSPERAAHEFPEDFNCDQAPRVMQPDEPFFGPSNMQGPMPNTTAARKPHRRVRKLLGEDVHVAAAARGATNVAMVVLNGGPHDGHRAVVPLPLKRIIFPAEKPSRTNEINDFEPAHAYLQRRVSEDPALAKSSPYYDYVGFKSREEIKEEFMGRSGDADEADQWWRGE